MIPPNRRNRQVYQAAAGRLGYGSVAHNPIGAIIATSVERMSDESTRSDQCDPAEPQPGARDDAYSELAQPLPPGWRAARHLLAFIFTAQVGTELVANAATEALVRLQQGESHLAVHPRCGTNLAVTGILAGTAAFGVTLGRRRSRFDQFPTGVDGSHAGRYSRPAPGPHRSGAGYYHARAGRGDYPRCPTSRTGPLGRSTRCWSAGSRQAVFYIFHGEDEFDRDEAVARLRRELAGGDPPWSSSTPPS